ncbi:OmpA family protein [Tropicimonas sp. TH_r6]|uniref:OmpA family protein n=1 Tax=Tropicimonas sp. TH_r6 TaxID=3082085 RepID=UPI0029559CD3|nr:OmpA family protein [Tropicimonas sp. TH_r6]MDV7141311.1 OmpA family protein [Tropicimonas sp. TH_r6]
MKHFTIAPAAWLAGLFLSGAALADAPFDEGWTLDPAASALTFQSIKKNTVVETSSFASFDGEIDESGQATITVHLESIDTKIDLRNVRMRFIFFETFLHPRATITTQLDPALLADLPQRRRMTLPLDFTLDLHGAQKELTTDVVVTMMSEDQVFVSTASPISIAVADFNLSDGLKKLEEAAEAPIVPSATVSFDFMFQRNTEGGAEEIAMADTTSAAPAASRALESSGSLALDECRNRLEALSEANEVSFSSGSTRLRPESEPVLSSLVEIIGRCPDMVIEVGGHTDSVGSEATNQRLSEQRANAVARYLTEEGIDAARFQTKGYGESQPIAENDTDRGRWRNRRIAFVIVGE